MPLRAVDLRFALPLRLETDLDALLPRDFDLVDFEEATRDGRSVDLPRETDASRFAARERFVVFAVRMLGTSNAPMQTRASSFPTRLRPLDTRRSSDPGRAWERDSNCLERGAPCQTIDG